MADTSKKKERLEQLRRANEILFAPKSCPDCSQRLAVCLKPASPQAFPQLNVGNRQAESAYYCPHCKSYYDVEADYAEYTPQPKQPFAGDGQKYPYAPSFIRSRVMRVLIIQGLAAAGVIPLFLLSIGQLVQEFSILHWAAVVACGVILFALVFFFSYYCKLLALCKRAYFEIGEQGVIFCDGVETQYIPWQDFRMAQAIADESALGDSYLFDTSERPLALNENLDGFHAAALRIARHLGEDVPMNPRLVHQLYNQDAQ